MVKFMKKILSIFILMLSLVLLTSCELQSFLTTTGKTTTKSKTSKSTSSSEVTTSSSQTTKSKESSSNNNSSSTTEVIIPDSSKFSGRSVNTVKLMSINDTHGQLEEGSGYNMSLAQVDGAVNYLENQDSQKYIRIMAGDLFQGSFVSRFTYGRSN